jgi:hypothetical protein
MTPIQKFMIAAFVRVRLGVGIIGLIFPFVLWGVGKTCYQIPLAGSMSAYYHTTIYCHDPHSVETCTAELTPPDPEHPEITKIVDPPPGIGPMRNWFVGGLFIMGACLFLIHGFSIWEKILLDVAGLLAFMVALNPMPWKMEPAAGFPIHYVSAVSFFVMISFVCLFCSRKTLHYMPDIPHRKHYVTLYKWTYLSLGLLMAATPITARVFNDVTGQSSVGFWMEAFGIIAFGVYWILKTFEFHQSEIEKRAIVGALNVNMHNLSEDPNGPEPENDPGPEGGPEN